ncbi:MAG: tetratricopeptide repeat protein [Halieaceae bacterium]|jgi:TPR repeat protein|nr:tetratricopeptide repeat protein [Halieaceae bacterium]
MNQLYRFPVLVCLTLLLAASPRAEELPPDFLDADDRLRLYFAYAEFKMGNYPLARRMWETIDGKGKGEAHFNLGILHELGKGVPVDLSEAARHYRLAAQFGSRAGAYQMGLMHFTAPEFVDREEATKWLTEAALEGDEDAQELLVSMQQEQPDPLTEVRVALAGKDYAAALRMLEELVQQDEYRDQALNRLGWMYEIGMGVEADLARAAKYFSEAAELGNAEAMYAIAVMYLTGTGKPQNSALGEQWLRRSAESGDPRAADKIREFDGS